MAKAQVMTTKDGEDTYESLAFVCPGCALDGSSGLHMLPISGDSTKRPTWAFDGDLEHPTLAPSILTKHDFYTGPDTPPRPFVCHSFLRNGVFEFLGDCTHALANQSVPMPDLPEWFTEES